MAAPNDAASPPGNSGALATPPPPPQQPQSKFESPLVHNVALACTPIAVGAMFLPPRRLDYRMLVLGGVALWGMNQLAYDYRGRSLAQKYGLSRPNAAAQQEPEKLQYGGFMNHMPTERSALVQKRIQEEKARRLELAGLSDAEREQRLQELRRKERERRGALESIWMGDADEDWKEERDRKEKEALQEGGGGYWGLITEQLSEVWNRGEKKAQEKEAELKKEIMNTKDKVEGEVKKNS